MKAKLFMFSVVTLGLSIPVFAQNNQTIPTNQPQISIENISAELTNVSKSLQTFNKNFKEFLDKLPQGAQFSEK